MMMMMMRGEETQRRRDLAVSLQEPSNPRRLAQKTCRSFGPNASDSRSNPTYHIHYAPYALPVFWTQSGPQCEPQRVRLYHLAVR